MAATAISSVRLLFDNSQAPDLHFYRQLDAKIIYYPGFDLNPTNMYP